MPAKIFKRAIRMAIILEEDMYRAAAKAARARGLSFSALVRSLLHQYLQQVEGEQKQEEPQQPA